jgi:hypothetical protein
MMDTLAPLREFVTAMTALVNRTDHEPTLLAARCLCQAAA